MSDDYTREDNQSLALMGGILAVFVLGVAGCALFDKKPHPPTVSLLSPQSISIDTKERRILIDPCHADLKGWTIQVVQPTNYVVRCP